MEQITGVDCRMAAQVIGEGGRHERVPVSSMAVVSCGSGCRLADSPLQRQGATDGVHRCVAACSGEGLSLFNRKGSLMGVRQFPVLWSREFNPQVTERRPFFAAQRAAYRPDFSRFPW